ncbi:MAG: ASCH domain-containing protein [Bacteroidales bacterium]|nr:ASCH domain-containing protein [Bacteroidales bacterium]
MKGILISIKKEYCQQIFAGTKCVEYRKAVPKAVGEKFTLIIYESRSQIKKIVGMATVAKIDSNTPQKIWNQTHSIGGIEKEKFFEYFKSKEIAYAYHLTEVVKFNNPVSLNEIGKTAPQNWTFLTDDEIKKIINIGEK